MRISSHMLVIYYYMVLIHIGMNRQLISKLRSNSNFNKYLDCVVYFDVANIFEKANNDTEFNKTILAATARTMGDQSLGRVVDSGNYSNISSNAIVSSVSSSIRNSVQSSVQ